MTPQAGGGQTHTHTQSLFLPPLSLDPLYFLSLWWTSHTVRHHYVLCGHCHFLSDLQFEFQMFPVGKVSHQWRDARTLSRYSDDSLCQPADWGVVLHVLICFFNEIWNELENCPVTDYGSAVRVEPTQTGWCFSFGAQHSWFVYILVVKSRQSCKI